ncbi:MAG TPA: ABC transporter substrate-binding protein, partial [Kofleriaceae bacterium]|nr:ABC transporter substrate-binding protein [Kofleriaceae bacterium]
LAGPPFERARRARGAGKLFPLTMQIGMLVQVLAGLHYAHELADYDNTPMAIVHRDVTPSNVFITYDGQVKLVDFGIAKVLDSLNHTRVGVLKGKARYMAPEQIAGEAVDRRADVFSAGVMLWEMLANTQIWLGYSETEILRRVGRGEIPALPRDAPPILQQICARAMAHVGERYPTAEALRADLELYLSQTTPSREHGIGAAVSELFREERAQIRQLIEAELKGSRPSSAGLPALRDMRVRPLGPQSDFPAEPTRSGASAQLSYGGKPATEQVTGSGVPSRRKLYAGAAALAVMAILLVIVVLRGKETAPASPANARSPEAASVGAVVPPSHRTVASAVRGITDDTITLGMSAAFSGSSRELGNQMKLGLETAFAVVNDGGGVAGRTIRLLALDDGYEGKRALANVQELITDRKVFAIIGNVGTPTTKEALPYVLSKKVLFFGAFTGSGILRRDPPDRYVFNYRASYEDETAKMISYLIDVKKIPEHGIVVFAQNDSYGDAGYEGAAKMLRKKGRDDELLRVGYERNTVAVDDAVNKVVEYHNAMFRPGKDEPLRQRHPVKAIILVGTYKPCARFIQKIRDRKIDAIFLNVSFVGSSSLADELKELGPSYGPGVIVTQVVPNFDSEATGIIKYREALKKYHPDQQPDFVSLEGYTVGQLFAEGLRRAGREVDTEKLIDALEKITDYDPGTGGSLGFSMSQHQASHKVWGTRLDEQGTFRSFDME